MIPVDKRCRMKEPNPAFEQCASELVQCPLCGVSARKHLNMPTYLKEFGWTTPEGVNTYYTSLAMEEAQYIAEQEIQRRLQNGEITSNSQKKKLMRIMTEQTRTTLLNTKYNAVMIDIECKQEC
jgi:hypothetical protein